MSVFQMVAVVLRSLLRTQMELAAENRALRQQRAVLEHSSKRSKLRNRDGTYGHLFKNRIENMGIEQVVTAPRSPWQNAFVERLIGSIRG